MQILDLLGMCFDAAVVFVTKFLLLFKLAVAILWSVGWRVTKDFFLSFPAEIGTFAVMS